MRIVIGNPAQFILFKRRTFIEQQKFKSNDAYKVFVWGVKFGSKQAPTSPTATSDHERKLTQWRVFVGNNCDAIK